ncbi:hypothetical protein [Pseudarthrobacter sp. NS4]|uniref:hypothetical protein n=1 Tax=Pseudarthrobacter sp. NS4 TaxID=2973976 RepID=UPI002162D876|nr:hypothetical protein [Pseudarthrobacter sp. NS4]
MVSQDFFTDRMNGPAPRIHDNLPEPTSRGLYELFKSKADGHWFANHFPEQCQDGKGVAGTNFSGLWGNVRALVPQLEEEKWGVSPIQPDGAVFDLMEYAASKLSKPVQGVYHSYLGHHELTFDQAAGRKEFREEVNQILRRGGTMYELSPNLQIVRIGTPAVQQVIAQMTPASGDPDLDDLLLRAKALYISHKQGDRALALEKLWDGFERLKTIDVLGNKKQSANALLDHIASSEFKAFTSTEMKALTDFGNQFMIRHHETDKHPVPKEAQDYLFARMGSLIVFLLKASNRLG